MSLAARLLAVAVLLASCAALAGPAVLPQIREEFPGRIKAIYIRDAGGSMSEDRLAGMVLFQDARAAAEHAAQSGLADPTCVAGAFPAVAPPAQSAAP